MPVPTQAPTRGPFAEGERVLVVDSHARRYLVTLKQGGEFHTHLGALRHDDLIGHPEGTIVTASRGSTLLVFRPTLADFVLKMQRGAQVVYPKDLGLILIYADIFPGARVLEAGTGSASLTLALLRSVGEVGSVVSYELREDHYKQALTNIEAWYRAFGAKPDNLELVLGDVFDAGSTAAQGPFDRIVLDLPEPWQAVATTAQALVSGGTLCCYLPTVPQVMRTVEAMRAGGFALINTFEGLVRGWNVSGQSVRPDHRMVAHTGFIITGRRLAPTETLKDALSENARE
ncbi:MAG TPA: tRNA (adenine-N1)-methyltransferase [Actinomycetota bacterium]|nr:tRNA (adenine-N1)-methyltransferase [Actinomycetota bacterium]